MAKKNTVKASPIAADKPVLARLGWGRDSVLEELQSAAEFVEAADAPVDMDYAFRRLLEDATLFLDGFTIHRCKAKLGCGSMDPDGGYERQEVKVSPADALEYGKAQGKLWQRKIVSGNGDNGPYCFLPSVLNASAYAFGMSEKKDGWSYFHSPEKMETYIAGAIARKAKQRAEAAAYVERQAQSTKSKNANFLTMLKAAVG